MLVSPLATQSSAVFIAAALGSDLENGRFATFRCQSAAWLHRFVPKSPVSRSDPSRGEARERPGCSGTVLLQNAHFQDLTPAGKSEDERVCVLDDEGAGE